LVVFRSLRLDRELARSVHVLHRIDPIDHKVHEHLLQLHAIPHDLGNIFCELRSPRDLRL
jgi:hypothetical protein